MTRELCLALCLAALTPGLARAQACDPAQLPLCVITPTGAQGQDVAPYCFLPTLSRGQNETNYAVTASQDGQCHNFETFLRFDLPANLLGAGQTVVQARLFVPYTFSFAFNGTPPDPPHAPATLRVHRVNGNWSENSVTWAAKPGYDPSPLAQLTNITDFGTEVFDVTQQVRLWAHGLQTNFGFALTSPGERPLGFYSWEAPVANSQKVRLLIQTGPGTAPTPIPAMPALWTAALVLALASAIWLYAWDRSAASDARDSPESSVDSR